MFSQEYQYYSWSAPYAQVRSTSQIVNACLVSNRQAVISVVLASLKTLATVEMLLNQLQVVCLFLFMEVNEATVQDYLETQHISYAQKRQLTVGTMTTSFSSLTILQIQTSPLTQE